MRLCRGAFAQPFPLPGMLFPQTPTLLSSKSNVAFSVRPFLSTLKSQLSTVVPSTFHPPSLFHLHSKEFIIFLHVSHIWGSVFPTRMCPPEGRSFVCLNHWCKYRAYDSAWHRADSNKYLFVGRKEGRKENLTRAQLSQLPFILQNMLRYSSKDICFCN